MRSIILLVYFAILVYASYRDIKYMEVDDKISLGLYLLALALAVIDRIPLWQIVIYTISISGILYVAELVYQYRKKKNGNTNDDLPGIGGADIKITASIGLIVRNYALVYILISLSLALLISGLIQKKRVMPLIPYFTLGLVILAMIRL